MKKRKHDIKLLVLIVLILLLINSGVLIMTEGFGKNLVINIVLYIFEILVTIWILTDKGNRENMK